MSEPSDLPDLTEIDETVTFIENRSPASNTPEQADRDEAVLGSIQPRLTEMLARQLPARYDKDRIRGLLDRVNNTIERIRRDRLS
ncbi:hypothetical protein [Nakamurella lactea]|uniref:hypothetical protein n=1 Tax=Nakamurella lactea TaxID=459515 RepID=UPI0012B52114|nr:hypothetical protein [Nakamurella lactea]